MPITDPAKWTEQLRRTLECYDEPLIRQVAAKLARPRNQWPADELIERCLATLGNAAVIDRRLKELEPEQRRALALIAHSRQPRWPLGNLIEMLVALGHADGLPPLLALLESGLLYPVLPEGVKRLKSFEQWLGLAGSVGLTVFAHPQITSRAVGADLGLPDLSSGNPSAHFEKPGLGSHFSPLTTHHQADGLEWLLRLAILWQQVSAAPLRRTQQGDFFKRDLERLAQDGLLTSAPADSLTELPDPGLLAVALAEIEGVAVDHKGELRVGTLPASWDEGLLPALASLWSALPWLKTWNALEGWTPPEDVSRGNPYPSAYLLSVLLLVRLPADAWLAPADVEAWLFENHPFWKSESIRPSQRASWLGTFLLGVAYQLRMVEARKHPETGGWLVRLSPTGRWLLELGEPPASPPVFPQTLLVQPNLEIVAYRQGLTTSLVSRLTRFAAWKNLGAACTLQLDPNTVYRAMESGMTLPDILQTLERHGSRAVPMAVIDSLRTWSDKRERLTIYPTATLFEFATADDLTAALSRGLPGIRITDRLALVTSESGVDFRHFRLIGTRDYGLPPEKCVEVEADGVSLSIDPARSDLLVETELSRFAEVSDTLGRDGRRQFRMTFASLAAARASGLGVRGLEEWFGQRTGMNLPAAARLLLTASQMSGVELRRRLVLHVATAEIADGLQQWPHTRSLILERLGPTYLAVEEEHAAELRERLKALGMQVES